MGFRWICIALASSMALLATGCGHPVQRKLEGRWVGEAVENFDDRDVAVATGWAKGTSFEFAGDSVTVAVPAEEPRTGSYKVAKVHKNDISLKVTRGEKSEADTVQLKLDDEHSMRWVLSGNRAIVMRRE